MPSRDRYTIEELRQAVHRQHIALRIPFPSTIPNAEIVASLVSLAMGDDIAANGRGTVFTDDNGDFFIIAICSIDKDGRVFDAVGNVKP